MPGTGVGAGLYGGRVPAPAPWTPAALAPAIWFRTSEGTTLDAGDPERLAAWQSQGSIPLTISQAGAAEPGINDGGFDDDIPTIFNDGGQWIGGAIQTEVTLPQPYTIVLWLFIAQALAAPLGADCALDGGAAGECALAINSTPQTVLYAGVPLNAASAQTPFTWARYELYLNGAASELRRNGAVLATGNAGTNALTGLTFFALADGTRGMKNTVVEAFAVSGALTAGNRADIAAYSAARYFL
jgi:hypothetical protein